MARSDWPDLPTVMSYAGPVLVAMVRAIWAGLTRLTERATVRAVSEATDPPGRHPAMSGAIDRGIGPVENGRGVAREVSGPGPTEVAPTAPAMAAVGTGHGRAAATRTHGEIARGAIDLGVRIRASVAHTRRLRPGPTIGRARSVADPGHARVSVIVPAVIGRGVRVGRVEIGLVVIGRGVIVGRAGIVRVSGIGLVVIGRGVRVGRAGIVRVSGIVRDAETLLGAGRGATAGLVIVRVGAGPGATRLVVMAAIGRDLAADRGEMAGGSARVRRLVIVHGAEMLHAVIEVIVQHSVIGHGGEASGMVRGPGRAIGRGVPTAHVVDQRSVAVEAGAAGVQHLVAVKGETVNVRVNAPRARTAIGPTAMTVPVVPARTRVGRIARTRVGRIARTRVGRIARTRVDRIARMGLAPGAQAVGLGAGLGESVTVRAARTAGPTVASKRAATARDRVPTPIANAPGTA